MMRAAIASVFVVLAVMVVPAVAAGQPARPPDYPPLEKVIAFFGHPVHPIVASVAPGSGIGAGIGYAPRDLWDTRGFAAVEGVFTVNRYWSTHATIGLQGIRYRVEAFARARDMKRLDFYGLGNESLRDDRTTFRLLDRVVGGLGSIRFGPVAFGGRLESLWPDAGSGRSNDHPSIEQRFTEQTAAGLAAQPHFAHYQGFVNVNYPYDLNARGWTGGDYRMAFSAFRDAEPRQYSFRRFAAEAQQRIPGFRDNQRLTLHGLITATSTDAGQAVPFYFQDTLGGAGAVRAFNEEIIGSDGSKATLRAFQDLRFRGPHSILLQAEYRWALWGPIDATAFVDAGKTTTLRKDLSLANLKHGYGFSVSLMTGDATALRVDTGVGGGEGAHVFFSIGPIFSQ